VSQESKLIERPPLDVAIQGAPRSMSRTLMRLSLPSVVVTLLYYLKYRCYVSPRAEVEYGSHVRFGRGTKISSFCQIKAIGPLTVGANVSVTAGVYIAAGAAGMTIGDDCLIGPHSALISGNYRYDRVDVPIVAQGTTSKGITIANNVWIGAGTVILDGSDVGEGVIIAPNSVVNSKLPPNTICEGNPAKPVFRRR
jgi:acetyltransferase-like isoleucine patch superfamily enzyme